MGAGTKGRQLRWLHIAQLGFGDEQPVEVLIREAYVRLLAERAARGEGVDLILASGEVARGVAAEHAAAVYEAAGRFFDRLLDAAHLERSRLLLVPGEGDLDMAAPAASLPLPSADKMDAFFKSAIAYGGFPQAQKLQAFARWYDRYFGGIRSYRPDSTCTVERLEIRGDIVAAVLLNTALLATPDHARGALWLGRRCWTGLKPSLQQDADFKLILTHHPLSWLHDAEQTQVIAMLRRQCDVVLQSRFGSAEPPQEIAGTTGSLITFPAGQDSKHFHAYLCTARSADGMPAVGSPLSVLEVEPLRYEDTIEGLWVINPTLYPPPPYIGTFAVPRLEALPTAGQSPTESPAKKAAPTPAAPAQDALDVAARVVFLEVLHHQFDHLDMVGLAGGELRLHIDEVYTPLRVNVHAGRMRGAVPKHVGPLGLSMGALAADVDAAMCATGSGEVTVRDALSYRASRGKHLFILGEPGAGKTTALKKLLWSAIADDDNKRLPLPDGVLPLFGRLQQWSGERAQLPLSDFLQHQLDIQAHNAGKALPGDWAARLWRRGKLLVLLDGLDEVAELERREAICRYLQQLAAKALERDIRLVVSSRFSGIEGDVHLDEPFVHLDVRPLQPAESTELAVRWFAQAERQQARLVGADEQHAAQQGMERARTQMAKLHNNRSPKMAEMMCNPLLLTLMCLVVKNAGDMPERRHDFLRQCLDILLGSWSRRDDSRPPLSPPHATMLLRPLAWAMHQKNRQYDMTAAEIEQVCGEMLLRLRRDLNRIPPFDVILHWLHKRAGVLTQYADDQYGFSHLHFQEYLAADHAGRTAGDELGKLVEHFGKRRYDELFQLLVAIHENQFVPLMKGVLKTPKLLEHQKLIGDCLAMAPGCDLSPFTMLITDPGETPQRVTIALGLVANRGDKSVYQAAINVLTKRQGVLDEAVRAGAERIEAKEIGHEQAIAVAQLSGSADNYAFDVFLSHNSQDKKPVREVARRLRACGLRPWLDEEQLVPGRPWQEAIETILGEVKSAAVFFGPAGLGPWEEPEMRACLGEYVKRKAPVIPVLLEGAPGQAELPLFMRAYTWVDMRGGISDAAIARIQWGVTGDKPAVLEGAGERRVVLPEAAQDAFVLPGGVRMLAVPGGRFMMGADDLNTGVEELDRASRPAHPVEVSPFWLAEVCVTNAQYRMYLDDVPTAERPALWNDRRFNDPNQPVVGVSWQNALAYCRWLTSLVSGRVFQLPTEAQWEFAARGGGEARVYPWGDVEPTKELADFGQSFDTGQPRHVGSCPQGRGRFGTLDQAGSVWEWCADAFDDKAYHHDNRPRIDPTGPAEGEDANVLRAIRGGSWLNPVQDLHAAYRLRLKARSVGDEVGFRVAAPQHLASGKRGA